MVTDSSGARVAGAEVTASARGLRLSRSAETNGLAELRIEALARGAYEVNVEAADLATKKGGVVGPFRQNYSPDSLQEFTLPTAQFDADTSRTTGGSVILSTRRGTNDWHGSLGAYYRNKNLNARNQLDNPEPNPKQPFSRENGVAAIGGPLAKDKLWIFSAFEYVNEDSSVAYNNLSLAEFRALAQLASAGQLPGVSSIAVPTSVSVPFHDSLFSTRVDFAQSQRSHWFLRAAFDLNDTTNDLLQQATLPSTGADTTSHYSSVLLNNQLEFTPTWIGSLTLQASYFHHVKVRNSHLGFALAFPFSADFHTTSWFDPLGA